MAEIGAQLEVPLMVGVGAAFDMNSARLTRAPQWMQNSGLEWLYRLLQEPDRLWKRYLVVIPEAAWAVALELLGLRKFDKTKTMETRELEWAQRTGDGGASCIGSTSWMRCSLAARTFGSSTMLAAES